MDKDQAFEIPKEMRDLAERNVEQARAAHQQLMDVARQAQSMMSHSQAAAAAGALEVQQKAMSYAEQNINESFEFAAKLARTGDLKSALELQQEFTQRQFRTCGEQAQELSTLLVEAAQRIKPKV